MLKHQKRNPTDISSIGGKGAEVGGKIYQNNNEEFLWRKNEKFS